MRIQEAQRLSRWFLLLAIQVMALVAEPANGSGDVELQVSQILAWGRSTNGETNPPAYLTNVVAISAGNYYGLALRDDGTVASWGTRTNIPPGLSNVIQIDAGSLNSIALKSNGKVTVWGGTGLLAYYTNFATGLSNIMSVAAGDSHFAALQNDGRVIVWATQGTVTNVPSTATNAAMIAAAANYCLALRTDGKLVAWGSGPTNVPVGISNVVAIAAGSAMAGAVRNDGSVVVWGSSGVVSLPATLTNMSSLAIGSFYGLGLRRDGVIVPWGNGLYGQTNVPHGFTNFVAVATDLDFSLGLVSQGPVHLWHVALSSSNVYSGQPIFLRARAIGQLPLTYQWQLNGTDIVGATNSDLVLPNPGAAISGAYRVVVSNSFGGTISEVLPVAVIETAPFVLQQPFSAETNVYATATFNVVADGSRPISYQWLSNGVPVLGATNPALTISNLQVSQSGLFNVVLSNAFGVVTSAVAGITIRPVISWGLGDGGRTNVASGVTNVVEVAAGYSWNLALRRSGTVQQWGTNFGPPAFSESLSNVSMVSARGSQSIALNSNGTVTAWGIVSNAPSNLDDIVSIAAGANFYAALKSDGTISAWGDNMWGQTNVPIPLVDAVEIAAGDLHGLAIRKDGSVRGWGYNQHGQADAPLTLSNIVAIAAGFGHSMALRDDGKVVVWGANHSGQTNVPFGLSNVVAIAAGGDHSMALRRDGTVVEWGGARYSIPRTVTNVMAVAIGENHFLSLIGEGSPFVRRLIAPHTDVSSGERPRLSVDAIGQWPLAYQWRFNGVDIPGATNAHLSLPNIQVTNSGIYSVMVSNPLGSVVAEAPLISAVDRPPEIRVHPVAHATNITGSADFEAVCKGSEPLLYQWLHNGNPIPGATRSRLQLPGLNMRQAGEYSVVVGNAFGVVGSSNAMLSISPLVAWGCSDVCPPPVPTDGFDIVALAAGDGHGLAQKSDGTVVAWGKNDQGQATVPIGLTNVVAVSACEGQSLALRSDGTVVAWGWRTNVPLDLRDVVAISAGEWHDLAFKANGEVVSWGFWNLPRSIVPSWATNALGGASSRYHSTIFRRDGSAVAWNPDSGSPVPVPPELQNVVAMASHLAGVSALRSDGSVVLWGNGISSSAVSVANGDFVSHAVGRAYSLGLTPSGAVVAWQSLQFWEMPIGLQGVVAIASGGHQGLALAGIGKPRIRVFPSGISTAYSGQQLLLRVEAMGEFPLYYQWLLNGVPIIGATNATFFRTAMSTPGNAVYGVNVSNARGATNVHVASFLVLDHPPTIVAQPNTIEGNLFSNATFSVVADGSGPLAYQWQFDGEAIPGATNSVLSLTNLWPTQTGVYRVFVSNRFGTVVSAPAELGVMPVIAWGWNAYGQTDVPSTMSRVVDVSASARSVVALNADATLARWGDRFSIGGRVPLTLTNIIDIASSSFNLALSDTGEAYEWDAGPNETNVSLVATGTIAIAAGYGHRMVLKSDGTVVAWGGANNYGQTNVPSGLSNVVALAAGYDHSIALLANGTVRSWGNTNYGLNNTAALNDCIAVAGGGAHSMVLKSNGIVVAWGWNGYGQTNVPANLSNIVAIAAGPRHSMALRSDGTVAVWGDSQFGALAIPYGLSNVVAISAGEQYCVALVESPSFHRRLLEPILRRPRLAAKVPGFSGRRFTLEATDSLFETNWTPVETILGRGAISTLSDTNFPASPRFYRFRRE